ncbi:MAG: hypothetical protein QXF69_06160 [Thermofilaceae archaeon]
MAGATVYEITVEELEQLLTDVAERFREGDLEGAAQRVSVLFSPPYAEMWRSRARRSFAKLRGKLKVNYGGRLSERTLFMRSLHILCYSMVRSIVQYLGVFPSLGSRLGMVAAGTAYRVYIDLTRGWRETAYARVVTQATGLKEGFGIPYAAAFKLMALAAAIAFYLVRNPSPIEELYYETEKIRQHTSVH